MELERTERRILGALIEKRWSTPEQYPLSENSLLAACNQRSNRDPILDLTDFEIAGTLIALREKGLVLIREREGGRVRRYAERLTEELGLSERASAVLAELLLRGPQTAPELLRRVPRMVPAESQNQIDEALSELAGLHLVRLLARGAGQRHARWTHLLAPEGEIPAPAAEPESAAPSDPGERRPSASPIAAELAELRREVEELRERVARLEAGRPGSPPGSPPTS